MFIFNDESYPSFPGVYIMKALHGEILYIGKAKNLKKRLSQYKTLSNESRQTIHALMPSIHEIETIITKDEREAILLEQLLIKQHQPKYNILLKDDKTFLCLTINMSNQWPRLRLLRSQQINLSTSLYVIGPFTESKQAYLILSVMQNLFPLRSCSDKELARRTRPCILYEMKKCLAPCCDLIQHQEYLKIVNDVSLFFKGKFNAIKMRLNKAIKAASEQLQFEKAGTLFRALQQINKLEKLQSIPVSSSIDADVIGIAYKDHNILISIICVRNGHLINTRNFYFNSIIEEENSILRTFIMQYYALVQDLPPIILIPLSLSIKDAPHPLSLCQASSTPTHTALLSIAKQEADKALQIKLTDKNKQQCILTNLQKVLSLKNIPKRIESIDSSHCNGKNAVAVICTIVNGESKPLLFKSYDFGFNNNDHELMREALKIRFFDVKDMPDLIVIDGGKGNLSTCKKVLDSMGITHPDVISISKDNGKHSRGLANETIHYNHNTIILNSNSNELLFLQKIRNITHDFAIAKHRGKLTKKSN